MVLLATRQSYVDAPGTVNDDPWRWSVRAAERTATPPTAEPQRRRGALQALLLIRANDQHHDHQKVDPNSKDPGKARLEGDLAGDERHR